MAELRTIDVPPEAAGQRLDQFLAAQLEGVSRSRVQLLMEQGDVLVDGEQEKASMKLRGGERIAITGEPHPAPLRATPEDIPLDVVFEDADLAVVNKPAGMMVHAGSGQNEDARNRGTLVNALLYRFKALSSTGGDLRPGIVHRLDKGTSGLIVVAKNDRAHAALGEMFASRRIKKTYIALVEGAVEREKGTINAGVGPGVRARGRLALRGGPAIQQSFRQVHAGSGSHRDRQNASDPRTHGVDRPSGGGRHALWRCGTTHGPDCLAGRNVNGRAAQGGAGEAQAGTKLSTRRTARVCAPRDGKAAGARGAAARGVGDVPGAVGSGAN
jgi:RluA family pseudouridine synthase